MSEKYGSRKPKNLGQGFVEFALIIPVLLLLILVIVDLGRITYAYSALQNAVREGARYGVVNFHWEDTPDIVAYTQDYALGLSKDPSDLSVNVVTFLPPTSPPRLTVDAAYRFRTASPILWLFTGSSQFTLRAKSTAIIEYLEH